MSTVTHHGRSTAYDVANRGGVGPPICFVHGTGSSRVRWRAQHDLAASNPVVTLDLSGRGDSDDVDAAAGYSTLSAYADDVLAVVRATDARVLVGSSLGGAVIIHLLLERELEPDGIVLVGTGARLGVLDDLRVWLEADFDRALEFLHEPGHLFLDPDPELRDRSIETMRGVGQRVVRRDFETCHAFDTRDHLSEIDVPALAIYGERDRLTPPWFHEYLADELPDCDAVAVEDAAHLVMLEQPDAFNDVVRDFLTAIDA
ncbi:alpha/beta fold hydrolase [Natrarchaeobius oligotrophus]|uniref:Alpha/beta hydrolase n=1 Tax=Natrarchaeobius chitinivorans TaxID=1679083 RepID=A0A3N6MGX1_NATCH|nr:alpha/beta hydrolase [Natrarchaeobius chitinivorans]RQH00275.1 alpha/beta hydrolase [Natrarchaeobius chitinivorans]